MPNFIGADAFDNAGISVEMILNKSTKHGGSAATVICAFGYGDIFFDSSHSAFNLHAVHFEAIKTDDDIDAQSKKNGTDD